MEYNTKESKLKDLIIKGKRQGFLTYEEINDHLPETMNDLEHIESIVNLMGEMEIDVLDEPPDPDSLILKSNESVDDEDAAEEAEEVLKSEFGSTTDPVRMYMREMGQIELLTRSKEIELAKRIQSGLLQAKEAVATCPLVFTTLIGLFDRIEGETMRVNELCTGIAIKNKEYVVSNIKVDESENKIKLTLETLHRQFELIRKHHKWLYAEIERNSKGVRSDLSIKRRKQLEKYFMQFKFVRKQIDDMFKIVHDADKVLKERSKVLEEICINQVQIPRMKVHEVLQTNLTHRNIVSLLKERCNEVQAERLGLYREEIKNAKDQLCRFENEIGMPINDFRNVRRLISIGETRAIKRRRK